MRDNPGIDFDNAFYVDGWYVEPSLGRISRQQQTHKLEPKVMMVLVCLAREAGQVISREQLESRVWAGQVVGYDSLASTIIKLRKAFDDNPRQARVIETVPKKGYRLIAAVEAADVVAGDQGQADGSASLVGTSSKTDSEHRNKLVSMVVIVLVFTALLLASYLGFNKSPDKIPDHSDAPVNSQSASVSIPGKIAVAVLPFKNISNDSQQDYFSDGITADLITDLSKLSALSVIARNSVFTYKDQSVDVRTVGRELGVQYIVEGSVRKAADEVRISARLIDAGNGFNLWAERFDGRLENVFSLQDRISAEIVSSLKVKLTDVERVRMAQHYTMSIEAYEQFLKGWQLFWNQAKDSNEQAREFYLRAIELDNNFARAYANLALTHAYDYLNTWTSTPELSIRQARDMASRAVDLDDSLPQVHWVMGLVEILSREYKHALQSAERAIALDPNYADAYGLLGTTLNFAGKPRLALDQMNKAMRLNPRYPAIYRTIRGEIYFNLREYDRAIEDFRYSLERNPEAQEPRLWLAAAYANSGRLDDAKWEVEQLKNAGTRLSVEDVEKVIPFNDPSQIRHLIEGLYKAGLE